MLKFCLGSSFVYVGEDVTSQLYTFEEVRKLIEYSEELNSDKAQIGNKYECGHVTNGVIILDDNMMSMTAYFQWAEEEKNLETKKECFDCFLKELNSEKEQLEEKK